MTETPAPRPEASTNMSGPILVGVMPGQHPVVVEQAATLAASARLPLVCAYADVTVYPVDGTPEARPLRSIRMVLMEISQDPGITDGDPS